MKPRSLCHIVAYIHLLSSVISQKDKRKQKETPGSAGKMIART